MSADDGSTPRRSRRTNRAMDRSRSSTNAVKTRCATSSRAEARSQAAPGTNSQKIGDLYKSFMDEAQDRVARHHAAQRRTGSASRGSLTPASCPRRSRARRRSACACPSLSTSERISATPISTPSIVTQSGLGMPDRDYYLRTDGTVRRDAQGLHHLHRQVVCAGQSARSGRRRGAHRRARDQARREAVGSRAQSRSQRDLQQDGRRLAAGLDAALRLAGYFLRRALATVAGTAEKTRSPR